MSTHLWLSKGDGGSIDSFDRTTCSEIKTSYIYKGEGIVDLSIFFLFKTKYVSNFNSYI